jgi:NitT/TauT family transport system substrate-binding protein
MSFIRIICAAALPSLICLIGMTDRTQAQDYNTSSYESIDAMAKAAAGPGVNITTNYWLAWTGAWDTVVMKETELWKKWLPAGSEVHWVRNLQGPPVITDLIANKQQIGYLGDNPSLVSITKRSLAPIQMVAVNETSPGRMCGEIIVGSDAPNFKNIQEAAKWLDGKVVAVPKGSCADRLGQYAFEQLHINVTWQQMQAEVCVTALEAHKVDAAAVYEPHAAKAVMDGVAKYAISANAFHEADANTILMRKDFVDAHRDAAVAWLKADVEGLYFLRDHPVETVGYVKSELPGYTKENLWDALYGPRPADTGASAVVLQGAMVFTPSVMDLLKRSYAFLYQIKTVREAEMPPEGIETDLVTQAFNGLRLDPSKGLYEIKAGPKNPFKGDDLIATPK